MGIGTLRRHYVDQAPNTPAADAVEVDTSATTKPGGSAGRVAVKDLPGLLASMDLEAVLAMQAEDPRKTAAAVYAARLSELASTSAVATVLVDENEAAAEEDNQ